MEKCSMGFSSLRRFDKMEYNWYANKHTSYIGRLPWKRKEYPTCEERSGDYIKNYLPLAH
jgi:hypothetical protein